MQYLIEYYCLGVGPLCRLKVKDITRVFKGAMVSLPCKRRTISTQGLMGPGRSQEEFDVHCWRWLREAGPRTTSHYSSDVKIEPGQLLLNWVDRLGG
jgi:hypothetical protein